MSKTFVVVGGTSGIGLEVTRRLNGLGHTLHVISRNPFDFSTLDNVTHYICDVTRNESSLPSVEIPVDGLVYCPGTIDLKPFSQLKLSDYQRDWDVNFLGAVKVIKHFLPTLKKSESSSIVLFSTVAVQTGMPFHASIASAKGAVEGFTRALAAELAPKIRVNAIAPSLTNTPLATSLLNTPTKEEHAAQRHPLRRVGRAEDIAAVAVYLLSDAATWITGQMIPVDGGLSSIRIF